jgi:XTP/dITP diphosphohydrolase
MVTFVTTNEGKVREARAYLDAPVEQRAFDYPEVQADDLATVAAHGARAAYRELGEPVFVDDSGLTIEALDGFPGPYSSYVEDTLGIERVWHLAEAEATRSAAFRGVIAYCDGEPFEASPEPVDSEARPAGASGDGRAGAEGSSDRRGQDLAAADRGGATADDQVHEADAAGAADGEDGEAVPVKLFEGVVPGTIVAPRGEGGFGFDPIFEYDGTTFAEMDTDRKNSVSHRGRALARFAEWHAEVDR